MLLAVTSAKARWCEKRVRRSQTAHVLLSLKRRSWE